VPDTYQQTIPGYTVMYVFFIITSLAGSIRSERLFGTFRRLLSAPISRANLLGGKLLATMLVGLLQVFLLFGAGALLFGLRLGNDPLAFFLLTLALVAAATAVGLAAATTRLSGGVLAAPLIIAALLGGSMFPLDLMPPFLRVLSRFVPHSWALTGYQNLMVRGLGIQEVLPQIAVLAGFAVLFFLIALRRFDFETQETA
jgi:ABC-2 type transport system permease protein